MAVFNYLSTTDWNYYFDFAGSSVLTRNATTFQYLSTAGLTVTLHGSGFTYDVTGIPTAGTIARMDVVKNGIQVGHYTGLTTPLTAFETLAFGHTSGAADTPVSTVNLYTLLQTGDDVINGNDLSKTLVGNAGDDTIYGNGGDDWMQGAAGTDRYYGGTGRNGVYFDTDPGIQHGISVDLGKTKANILDDGYGNTETATNVQMIGGSGFADLIKGGATDNTLYGHGGNDTIYAGAGNDYVQAGDGQDQSDGGAGLDWLSFTDVPAGHHGAVVNLAATSGPTVLDDGFGNSETATGFEYLAGTTYADQFTGSKGDNVLSGNDGNDSLYGGKGNDIIYGGGGDDRLIGGSGFEVFFGGKGRDYFDGGSASDYLYFSDVDGTGHGVTANLGKSKNQIADDGYGNTETARNIEHLLGTAYGDKLTGNNGVNDLWGGAGNDTLYGGGAFDQLDGGDGADRLFGGKDIDTLSGGQGNDTLTGGNDSFNFFYFDDITPGLDGVDHITDFQSGEDLIVANTNWAADIDYGTITAAQFLAGSGVTAATTSQQRFLYDTATGKLYFDADGTGSGATAALFAILDNHATLTSDQISAITTANTPP
ncbi:MAG: calcium-binding protein [bacterium]